MKTKKRYQRNAGANEPSTQKQETENGKSRDKFPEPRAWALNWDTEQPSATGVWAKDGSVPSQEPKTGERSRDKFPEPRGWALEWDGDSIWASPGFSTGHTLTPGTTV